MKHPTLYYNRITKFSALELPYLLSLPAGCMQKYRNAMHGKLDIAHRGYTLSQDWSTFDSCNLCFENLKPVTMFVLAQNRSRYSPVSLESRCKRHDDCQHFTPQDMRLGWFCKQEMLGAVWLGWNAAAVCAAVNACGGMTNLSKSSHSLSLSLPVARNPMAANTQ